MTRMTVHIVNEDKSAPLCGFTGDLPLFWPAGEQWVWPVEAHYATCQRCIELLHSQDERECQQLMNGY
jgi:hypothetical protein